MGRYAVVAAVLFAIQGASSPAKTPLPRTADVLRAERADWQAAMLGIVGNDGATDPDFSASPQAIFNLRCSAKGAGRAFCNYVVTGFRGSHRRTGKRLMIMRESGHWTRALDDE
ncbi:hypothetical protein TomTYG75_19990 [Sphingobium sp. TomTYG75]